MMSQPVARGLFGHGRQTTDWWIRERLCSDKQAPVSVVTMHIVYISWIMDTIVPGARVLWSALVIWSQCTCKNLQIAHFRHKLEFQIQSSSV